MKKTIEPERNIVLNANVNEGFDNPTALASARYVVKIDADERRVAYVRCV